MRSLWTHHDLAARLGEELDRGEVLLGPLPARNEAPTVTTGGTLALVLGDQLTVSNPALDGADAVLMIEAPGEATFVWSHKARIAVFLAAMRHFRDTLREEGRTVHYVALGDSAEETLEARLAEALLRLTPSTLRLAEPGEWRLARGIEAVARLVQVDLRTVVDTHFLCSSADFGRWASRYTGSLRMEYFYREMRRRHGVLLTTDGEPIGGKWNYDADNRKGYPKSGPGTIPPPAFFPPDALTRQVIAEVETRFADHPGSLDSFGWPVTRANALEALDQFLEWRLAGFGTYQDAMWSDTPFGWHSLLSVALNLHLLDPREVIAGAETAYHTGAAPLAAVEGFVRQVLGWREFIRGVYFLEMPGLAEANHFGHQRPLPRWYWTGSTNMACLADAIDQTMKLGYAHHIQRLMVTGLFSLLAGLDPKQVAAWYLAVYVDAVEWAELPNVAGMALYADGGRFTSKPYVASGAYIQRMSNYCNGCHYAPDRASAAKTLRPLCPFTVLYWAFLDRHETALAANPRTGLMAKNVARLGIEAREKIRADADDLLSRIESL